MGELLPNTPEIREATAAEKLESFLNGIEDEYLDGKQIERGILKKFKSSDEQKDIIDISSASSMNTLNHILTNKESVGHILDSQTILEKTESYPFLVQHNAETEQAFTDYLRQSIGVEVSLSEVLVFNSIYRSFNTLLTAFPGAYVIVPEYMHHTQKACFRSVGKELIEISITPEKKYDLTELQTALEKNAGEISCAYLYHARPVALDNSYLESLANLLNQNSVTALVDLDVIATQHTNVHSPVLPLEISTLRKNAVYLFNLSKEIGAPGIRIGFGVAPAQLAKRIKKFQQTSLDMIPPVTKHIATVLLEHADVGQSSQELQCRMERLVTGLQSLSFEARLPNVGVNLFMHVPRAFEQSQTVLPDHLFAYYCLTRASVVLRPGSLHGHRLNHYVRFVVGQPISVIEEMLNRFEKAGISGDMELPESLITEYQNFVATI